MRSFGPLAVLTMAMALVLSGPLPASVHAAEIDPDADTILRQMSDHLAGLKSFSVTTEVSTDVLLRNGQKVQLVATGTGLFDRERGFHFQRQGVLGDMELLFDGRNLTLYSGALKGYRTIEVEGGNDAALDEVRAAFGIEAAGGVDLLYTNAYDGLLYEVESGEHLGETRVNGILAHHLAYRAAEVDWQLWVRAEGDPLPLRYVITSKWTTGAPQFTVQVVEWNSTVTVDAAQVTFTPPEGAKELEAIEFDAIGNVMTE
jgi:hypothetical protein